MVNKGNNLFPGQKARDGVVIISKQVWFYDKVEDNRFGFVTNNDKNRFGFMTKDDENRVGFMTNHLKHMHMNCRLTMACYQQQMQQKASPVIQPGWHPILGMASLPRKKFTL